MRLWERYKETIRANWHLGVTCFGGPAVQFQTFHRRFVEDLGWIDEPMYQQIFCLSQALPGSASVKMLLCINAIRNGIGAGFLAFFILPGAVGMYALAVGIGHVQSTLPPPAYALLSGLNAATVGVIALAAVKLAERAISDRMTRFLVYFGGVLGMLYYPLLMVIAGIVTYVWDTNYLQGQYVIARRSLKRLVSRIRRKSSDIEKAQDLPSGKSSKRTSDTDKPLPELPKKSLRKQKLTQMAPKPLPIPRSKFALPKYVEEETEQDIPAMSWPLGSLILVMFGLTFVLFTTLHIVMPKLQRTFDLFSSLYLAGTIIFGGGPVVIPLLRDYIVSPGWVSPRDFLLGVAVIQAFPGPNFNFVVYLGSLAMAKTSNPSFVGAIIAFIAMYIPGLFIVVGFMGLWRVMSNKKWFLAILRGINAAAVGLVFTAVYKLWQMGYLTAAVQEGGPLGTDPWLVFITATAYVSGAWFGFNPPTAILLGGILGIVRYGVLDA
ncbi:uncharacterized protein KY384_004246 [Bacidia gigantensis]|uniref:uncharacterized protein n=1 Tax=Bacidia gigantensis TaxID=2732470 RepID=UPI001D03857F|nr:uncharacterized protein KY384_004246 [Bacidia gigantensis]KAG8530889.1 hypothetical protein KY384_004246 [Bacidia gigantensis]